MERHSRYELDFPAEKWEPLERWLLEPFATNLDGFVSVLHNLPPEIVGALCSRASRARGSLLRVFLDEYLLPILNGEDRKLSDELVSTMSSLHKHGFKNILNNQRAQAFYAKWLAQYGDDSIAQMTGAHVVFWGISQVAMKFVEDQRIGLEPIEKSTRYVNFGEKVNGRYLYCVPRRDLERFGLLQEYTAAMDSLFGAYAELQPRLFGWLRKNFSEEETVLEKKSFDILRGLLPMATLGQVAFRGNAQAFKYLIDRTAKHRLSELGWISSAVKEELDREIPSLLIRVNDEKSREYQAYLAGRREAVVGGSRSMGDGLHKFGFTGRVEPVSGPQVRLVEYDADAEDKILAGILFPLGNSSWESCLKFVKMLPAQEKEDILASYLSKRNARWQKVGRAFENSYLRFEIVMNIGAYRDLHRHRMLTQDRQLFSTLHGFDVPKEILEAGMNREFSLPLERVDGLFRKIAARDIELAQYVVPLAYRMRFYQWQNFRAFFWETELRTIAQGHPDYRAIEQEKYRLVREVAPAISKFMLVDMKNYSFARRGTEETIAKKERRIVTGLKKEK